MSDSESPVRPIRATIVESAAHFLFAKDRRAAAVADPDRLKPPPIVMPDARSPLDDALIRLGRACGVL
jgi:hypothetical protein